MTLELNRGLFFVLRHRDRPKFGLEGFGPNNMQVKTFQVSCEGHVEAINEQLLSKLGTLKNLVQGKAETSQTLFFMQSKSHLVSNKKKRNFS